MAINKNKVMDAARKAVEKGQVDKAIKEYLKVVKEDPKDVRVWLKIGDLYAKRGSKQDATDTYLKVAKFYSEQGFYLKAVAVYKQILKLDPRLVEVNLKLAELYRQLGLLSDAMQHFEMVAAFFHREGKTKEALATIRQLVDLDPENVATRIKLAELYSKEQMVEEAAAEFGHACDYLRKHNRQDDFIKVAERLLWHKPDNIGLSRELAGLYLRRSDARRALQKLQVCFKADSRDVETLALLAQAFQALDQKGKTVSVLKELARVLSENGQRAQAEDVHRKILMYVPDDPDSLAFLGKSALAPEPSEEIDLSAADVIEDEPPVVPVRRSGFGAPTGSMPLVNPADIPDLLGATDPLAGFDRGDSYGDSFDSPSGAAFMADLSLDEESRFADADSSVGGETHRDEIIKVLTETDVYVKYALHQKAIEHLRRVFELDPENVEARIRLKEILLLQGREDDAIRELLHLAEVLAPNEPARAEGYLREVLALDGGRREVFTLAERHRLNPTGGAAVEVIDEMSGGIEVDVESAVGHVPEGGEDELDFDDLDFERSQSANYPARVQHAAQHAAGSPLPIGRGTESGLEQRHVTPAPDHPYNRPESEFEFDIESAASIDAPPPGTFGRPSSFAEQAASASVGSGAAAEPRREAGTLEVDLEQVEDEAAVSVAELDGEELDFDGGGERDRFSAPTPYTPPPEFGDDAAYTSDDPDYPAEDEAAWDLPLDREDARAFDASLPSVPNPGQDELEPPSPPAHDFDAEPIGPHHDFDGGFAMAEAAPDHIPPPAPVLAAPQDPTHQMPLAMGRADAVIGGAPPSAHDVPEDAAALHAGGGSSLEDDLDEADFFVTQALYNEARDILESLLSRYPNHPLVMAKLRDVDQLLEGHEPVDEGPELTPPPEQLIDEGRPKPAVMLEKPIDDEDADTHYDLGLAYKEMGLFDEAIKAFHKVLNVSGRQVQCHLMIGLCYREQGNVSEAINQFKAGLYVDTISPAEKFDLYYEIGSCYESLNDPQEALYYYEMVLKKDAKYRDVAARVTALRGGTGDSHAEV